MGKEFQLAEAAAVRAYVPVWNIQNKGVFIMAWPQAGSTYNITSVKHPNYNLNLLGGYGIKDGTNVTLWPKSTTDTDQQ